jgi:TfoX/Sxy family transcriptional regulator of competence genes
MKPVSSTLTHLTERVRTILDGDPRITEKAMFGGLSFLLNGHILVACNKDGRILLSVGKENNEAALARPGATQMIQGGRTMRGFVWIDADAIEDDDDLRDWVRFAEGAVAQRPPDDPPAKAARKSSAKRGASRGGG